MKLPLELFDIVEVLLVISTSAFISSALVELFSDFFASFAPRARDIFQH